ncbi:MAG: TIGR03619 family F420-dependent LLM class oxidoreductase [Candidatus Limnocylindrales bacterium]
MDFGLILPTMPHGATAEGIEAAAETAARLGWATVWTTDHVLVAAADADEYGLIYEALVTLAYVAGRAPGVRLGTSVLVVPQRNAVVLAKELATLDALSRGRLVAGVGVGWSAPEFANLGVAERFRVRGAYLEETIRLWRALWGGATAFEGRFHRFSDTAFGPLPPQGARLPVLVGGRSEAALQRAGRIGDGYHTSQAGPAQVAERRPTIEAAARAAGRPLPRLSCRVSVRFGAPPQSGYAISGSAQEMQAEVRAFAAQGVAELALGFGETDPERVVAAMERFERDVLAAFRG